jgi:glycosyltransferase involved in cell wall biosynthesis
MTASDTPPGIIAFAKDWREDPTSNHHVLRELAKSRRVLWLNSIATRNPKLASKRDLGRIGQKVAEFARGPVRVENDLWVFTPLVIPLPHVPQIRPLNQAIVTHTIRYLRRRLEMDRFQLWTFLPNTADYVGHLGEALSVYYCVDEWSMFSHLDRDATVAAEKRLLAKVDCVFAVTQGLADAKRAVNPETHLAPHGVDQELFARALDPATPLPADLAALPRPILGFYGTLRDWVDVDLITAVARARPNWSLVLLGQVLDDLPFGGLPNVHLLGRKPHADLPAYCKGFDVGLIPYRLIERIPFVNPIKLREYLSAGLPVVSTPVPEVRRYADWCSIADTPDAFVAAVEKELAADSPERRQARSRAMTAETWPIRVADVARIVDEVARKKVYDRRSSPTP